MTRRMRRRVLWRGVCRISPPVVKNQQQLLRLQQHRSLLRFPSPLRLRPISLRHPFLFQQPPLPSPPSSNNNKHTLLPRQHPDPNSPTRQNGRGSRCSRRFRMIIISSTLPFENRTRRSRRGCRRSSRCWLRRYLVSLAFVFFSSSEKERERSKLTPFPSRRSSFFLALETILVRTYEDRMDLLRVLIIGPAGTP